MIYAKAKELLASGIIGKLNMVSAYWDRNSAIGAWDYSIPLDANTTTCDWPRFLGSAPKIPWNAEHFFQWRKWKAYGSGVAGDLFVHLFSGTHFITGSHGPTRAMATGAIRYWKDGRDADDVLLALFDYPEGFNLSLHVNFVDGGEESEGFLFTGSEGTDDHRRQHGHGRAHTARNRAWLHRFYLRRCDAAGVHRELSEEVSGKALHWSDAGKRAEVHAHRRATSTAMTTSITSLTLSAAVSP